MHGAYERTWSGDTQGVMSGMARGLNLDKIAFNFRYSSDNVARSNPWPRTLLSGDFILIAEFAENEGPKPVVSLTDYITPSIASITSGLSNELLSVINFKCNKNMQIYLL